jgi:hypothetical protein
MQKEGSKGSLRGKFKRAGWNDTYLCRLLTVFCNAIPAPVPLCILTMTLVLGL